jgi:hypothetical protein
MMDNHLYNLMTQLVQEHKSLWRIKHKYPVDTAGCAECKAFWEKMASAKEAHVAELQKLIKEHMATV